MYLHLGKDVTVKKKEIIGIFDIENTSVSKLTKEFLNGSSSNKQVTTVSYEMPKTFIVCENKTKVHVYISQISPATLKKRELMKYGTN